MWRSFSLIYNKKKKESLIAPNGLVNCFKYWIFPQNCLDKYVEDWPDLMSVLLKEPLLWQMCCFEVERVKLLLGLNVQEKLTRSSISFTFLNGHLAIHQHWESHTSLLESCCNIGVNRNCCIPLCICFKIVAPDLSLTAVNGHVDTICRTRDLM